MYEHFCFFLNKRTSQKKIDNFAREYLNKCADVYKSLKANEKCIVVRYFEIKKEKVISRVFRKGIPFLSTLTGVSRALIPETKTNEGRYFINRYDSIESVCSEMIKFFDDKSLEIMNISVIDADESEFAYAKCVYDVHFCFSMEKHNLYLGRGRQCDNWVCPQFRKSK